MIDREEAVDWRVKGVVQKSLSWVPFGVEANDLFRRVVRGRRHLDREIAMKVRSDWLVLMAHINRAGIPMAGCELLEIGTGWYPTLPTCFSLCGAARCRTFDLTRHMHPRSTVRMLASLSNHADEIAEAGRRSPAEVRADLARIASATSLEEALERARISYHAPADATVTGLEDGCVDVVFSNSVLEHVPRPVIARMMAESLRVLKPGGHAIHSVNCGDHYAYSDRRITQVNYLSYPEREWARWNNDLQYQNRLRACDFLDLARESGLEIVFEAHHAKPHLVKQVESMDIAPEFRHYPVEQLACTSIDFVARKPPA
jgi:SAM-dependent methyltransferase